MMTPGVRQWIFAAAGLDAQGVLHRPIAVLVDHGRILAVGSPQDFTTNPGDAQSVDYSDCLLLPALVNAHAHLDLSLLGPQPYPGNFVQWIACILQGWPRLLQQYGMDEEQLIRASILAGAQQSKQAGVGYVGDISDHPGAWSAMAESGLAGVSYLEVIGLAGQRLEDSLEALRDLEQRLGRFKVQGPKSNVQSPVSKVQGPKSNVQSPGVIPGVQPHAPYSTGEKLYQASVELADRWGLPWCTHLAETVEELEFVAGAGGAFQELLQKMGRWRDELAADYQQGLHPVDWLLSRGTSGGKVQGPKSKVQSFGRNSGGSGGSGGLLAHCNYVGDAQIHRLAQHRYSVAYCPIASEYFGHRDHRYRDMLAAGVNVCLGTDSLLCQPANEPQPLGMLPVLRRLYRRDAMEPRLLLQMATINGLRAMGLPEPWGLLKPGSPARFTLVPIRPDDPTDPLKQALENDYPARLWE